MTRDLNFGQRPAASGRTKSLLIFLHGYGADGADLLGLADPLSRYLPDTAFVAPDAPEPCSGNPWGRQWFPIPWLDGASEAAAAAGLARAADDLDAFIDARMAEAGVGPGATVLLGFSQGAMMALQVAPRRAAPLAAVLAFSGRLLAPERLAAETVSRPPVLLVHGDRDEVVPPAALPEAQKALTAAGFTVYAHVSEGTGHGIAPDGLGAALAVLRQVLPG